MADKRIMTTKSGKKYWVITIICKDCGHKYSYKTRYKKKLGRTKVYCDECAAIRKKETQRKDNEKREDAKAKWWKDRRELQRVPKFITALGGMPANESAKKYGDWEHWKHRRGLSDEGFQYCNEVYAQGLDIITFEELWINWHGGRCKSCGSPMIWDSSIRSLLCFKCGRCDSPDDPEEIEPVSEEQRKNEYKEWMEKELDKIRKCFAMKNENKISSTPYMRSMQSECDKSIDEYKELIKTIRKYAYELVPQIYNDKRIRDMDGYHRIFVASRLACRTIGKKMNINEEVLMHILLWDYLTNFYLFEKAMRGLRG